MELHPIIIALAVAVTSAVINWAYARFALKESSAEKVFFKTLASGLVATVAVMLYVNQFRPDPSLHHDPFFDPM